MTAAVTACSAVVHGHTVRYRTAGTAGADRPVLLVVHGIASDGATWDALLPWLGEWAYVVAPDLPGHGSSEAAGGDCSIASYAAWCRDLIRVLELPPVTIIGHSLGGGVAMQLSYMFPELVARLVLVCAGGLGREVSPWLRAATLPGAEMVIPVLTCKPVLAAGRFLGRAGSRIGLAPRPGLSEVSRGVAGLAQPLTRKAFLRTVRASLTFGGQAVDARDRLYLTQILPTLLLWGARDPIIPVSHGYEAQRLAVGSRLEVLERAGHFPHCDEPVRVGALLREFVETTAPGQVSAADTRRLVVDGA